mmetsp:Transcript_4368/g.12151  ORF Transcript_4368/g.12151 Transcript_4368/m.12151 type:complete len:201 (+) Transcript_4368:1259-1861(+)
MWARRRSVRLGVCTMRAALRRSSRPAIMVATCSARRRGRSMNGTTCTRPASAATRRRRKPSRRSANRSTVPSRTSPGSWNARGRARTVRRQSVATRSPAIGASRIASRTLATRMATPPRASRPQVGHRARSLAVAAKSARLRRALTSPTSRARLCFASWWSFGSRRRPKSRITSRTRSLGSSSATPTSSWRAGSRRRRLG